MGKVKWRGVNLIQCGFLINCKLYINVLNTLFKNILFFVLLLPTLSDKSPYEFYYTMHFRTVNFEFFFC